MKRATTLLPFFIPLLATAQIQQPPPEPSAYAVTERGPHHRVWQRTTYETAPSGQQRTVVHR
jgi:hypothetical protein